MFAYCGNNPVINYDPSGHCFHRLDFWNDCDKCGGKTIHKKLENTKLVVSSGCFLSINVCAFNIAGTVESAIDLKGNIQLFRTIGFDVTTSGGFSISGGSTDTMLIAPDTSALSGDSTYFGGGVSCPIPNTPISGCGNANILRTSDGYWGTGMRRNV